jgi:uncharacterized membrane protein
MTKVQQAIDVNAPVHIAYAQLSRFEDYPRFMEGIDAVRQTDDAHLHWSAHWEGHPVEWDAEITEQSVDRCIAWHNLNGPQTAGKVELQPADQEKTRLLFTLECEPGDLFAAQEGDVEAALAQRLEQDLTRLKVLIESQDIETGRTGEQVADLQRHASTQSELSLSAPQAGTEQEDPEQFRVAEEVNFDEQSDQARRIGQPPQEADVPSNPAEAMAKALRQGASGEKA